MTIEHTDAVHLADRGEGTDLREVRLEVRRMPLPAPVAGQLVVRNEYLSVDPAALGRMLASEKQYTGNFQVGGPLDGWAVGTVVDSREPGVPVGSNVRHRFGWRGHAVLDAAEVTVVDTTRAPAPDWLGVLGISGLTAYLALTTVAPVRPGDSVLISSAAGAVGSTACQLARAMGAGRVVGVAGGPEKAGFVSALGVDAVLDRREPDLAAQLGRALPDGVDVYLDNVGGDHLAAALGSMRSGGRVALCGMMSTFTSGSDTGPGLGVLMEAILRRVRLEGFIALDHMEAWPGWTELALDLIAQGDLGGRTTVVDGLTAGLDALMGLTTGDHVGKSLVRLP